MLVQITNACNYNCPHCLHNSTINGGHMSIEVFKKALQFLSYIGQKTLVISGGEPFYNPDWFEMIKLIPKDVKFHICSNGSFITNPITMRFIDILVNGFSNLVEIQVTTHPDLYPSTFMDTIKHLNEFDSIPKVRFYVGDIWIKDLGRARGNYNSFIDNAKYYAPSCYNGHIIARQSPSPKWFGAILEEKFPCHPLIDYLGYVHLSESWLCPTQGNIMDYPFDAIWEKIKSSKPCNKCYNAVVFNKKHPMKNEINRILK